MTRLLGRRQPVVTKPSLRLERTLLRQGRTLIAGMDEVGRGALAGPVSVGVVLVDADTRSAPVGLRDSKLLTPNERVALVPKLHRWCPDWAVGHASAAEVDRYGIIAALRLAGTRALHDLTRLPDLILLDGNHDWLSPPPPTLFDDMAPDIAAWEGPTQEPAAVALRPLPPLPALGTPLPPVRTMIKADLRCTAVAAASVLAKTARDAIMVELAQTEDRYNWAANKGYSAPAHLAALHEYGPCELHRRSWQLPTGPRRTEEAR